MSLNGLEDAKVQEAFEAAAAEPGGWFLLKYASRDEVEILDRGSGGVVEVRNAVAKYEEPSPLYGFLRYRRRNVILKYMPENCSRLIQARSAVHYNAVCDRLSPYDTTFEVSVAKDLKDSKLSAACSLHAASGSSSSSNSSLRRRRLNEIAEEEEEERERKRQSTVQEEERPRSSPESHSDHSNSPSSHHQALDPQNITSPPDTKFSTLNEPPSFNGAELRTSLEGRLSSQSTRPDLYSYATYTYGKPKVKLGPRPSLDAHKRPQTAGNIRPVAALPAGFKGFSKGSKKGKPDDKSNVGLEQREKEAVAETNHTFQTNLLDVPNEAEEQQTLSARPVTSSGASIKSVTPSITSSMFQPAKESNKMTPEKARLMKAMKMREKKMKMKASNLAESNPTPATHNSGTIEEEASTEADEQSEPFPGARAGGEDISSSILPSDSGISVDPPTPKSANTETRSYGTTSDSHPPSPTAASMSEIGDSTKASSLSGSTDETVQAHKEAAADFTKDDDDHDSNDDQDQVAHDKEQCINTAVDDAAVDLKLKPVETGEPAPEGPKVTPEAPPAETLKEVVLADATSTAISQSLFLESQQIPAPHASSLQTTEPSESSPDADGDTVASAKDLTSKHPTKLRTTDLDTPPDRDDSPKSVLGVPRSKFSTSEPKSSTSSSSSRSPIFPGSKLRSKFSTQDLKSASGTIPPGPSFSISAADASIAAKSQSSKEENKDDSQQQRLQENQDALGIPPKSSRRKSSIEPSRTDLATKKTPQSEVTDPLLDDALMDELQSAEVQEARPMLVSKSPITPVFPGMQETDPDTKSNSQSHSHLVRTVSNPMRGPLLAPSDVSQSSARSVSAGGAAFLHNITRQPSSAGLLKKGGVGSSISQRIKALEKLSGGTEDGRPKTATPTSSFYTVKKGTIQQASKSPSFADRDSSLTRGSPTPDDSREHSPETPEKQGRGRSSSMANRLTMPETSGLQLPESRGRPESIQVTARILRDHTQDESMRPQSRRDPNDFGPVELKESPLIIDVRKSEPEPLSGSPTADAPDETLFERRMSRELKPTPDNMEKKPRRPSLGIVKDFIKERRASVISKSTDNLQNIGSPNKASARPPSSQSNFARRLSTSSRRSLSYDRDSNNNNNSGALNSPTGMSDASGDDDKGNGNEKKSGSSKNRASRFMRRLSNSLTPNRKNVTASISPTLTEDPENELAAPAPPAKAPARTAPPPPPPAAESQQGAAAGVSAYMGDVNVQFPDNLLWKRRSMCLDSNGWLVLSAVQGAAVGGKKDKAVAVAGVKRYHLSEFRTLYAPDVEVQELPNSVRLDLVEGGSCLQIACEDRNGQMTALRCLQEAHRNHSSFGQ